MPGFFHVMGRPRSPSCRCESPASPEQLDGAPPVLATKELRNCLRIRLIDEFVAVVEPTARPAVAADCVFGPPANPLVDAKVHHGRDAGGVSDVVERFANPVAAC